MQACSQDKSPNKVPAKFITDVFKMRKTRNSPVARKKEGFATSPNVSDKLSLATTSKRCLKQDKQIKSDTINSTPKTPKISRRKGTPLSSPCTPISNTPNRHGWLSSQEQQGDVMWDYNVQPRETHVAQAKMKKGSLSHLMQSLKAEKVFSKEDAKPSNFLNLVDKWMKEQDKGNAQSECLQSFIARKVKSSGKHSKVQHMSEKMKALLQVIHSPGTRTSGEKKKSFDVDGKIKRLNEAEVSFEDEFAQNFGEASSAEDELWGNESYNDSFLYTASQLSQECIDELNMCLMDENSKSPCVHSDENNEKQFSHFSEIVTDITDSGISRSKVSEFGERNEKIAKSKNSHSKTVSSSQNIKQVNNFNTEESDNDLWEDSSVDEILCSIPEDKLIGGASFALKNSSEVHHVPFSSQNKKMNEKQIKFNTKSPRTRSRVVSSKVRTSPRLAKQICLQSDKSKKQFKEDKEENYNFKSAKTCLKNTAKATLGTSYGNEVSFRSDDLDDAPILQPDILQWLNEVESQVSGSQLCSQEEIAKKKAAAIRRRQKKQQEIQSKMAQQPHHSGKWKGRLRSVK